MPLSPLTKELQLILACSRPHIDDAQVEHIRKLAASGLNWDHLLKSASYHGMVPLLYHNLKKAAPEAVPPAIGIELQKLYLINARRCHQLTAEMLRLLDIFEKSGIPAIPFKGPALAEQLYGDFALRTYVDLDILVHKEDVLRAKEVLLKEGYEPEVTLNPKQEELFLRAECEYNFNHEARGVRLELHWRINPSCYCIDFDAKDIWQHLEMTTLNGREIPALSPEDLLIFICIHGARHNWAELKQICDLARMVELLEGRLNWQSLRAYSRGLHIERVVLLGLLLARSLYGIRLPKEVIDAIDRNIAVQSLSSRLIANLNLNPETPSRLIEEAYFWFCARERIVDRLGCIIRMAAEPMPDDIMQNPLPVKLYLLYYILHPIRLARQYGIKAKPR